MFEFTKRCRMRGTHSVRAGASLLAVALSTAIAAPAFAKPEAGKLSGAISGGVEFPVDGDVHKGATAPIANLGPLNPALAGVSAELRVEKRSFKKIYGETYNAAIDLNYGISDSGEVFGSVRHNRAGRGTVQVGNAFVAATNQTLPINATFSKYRATSVEAGYRQYFGSGTVQPYGAVRAGVGFVNKINASFAIPAASIAINDARFYKKSTIFTGGLDLGLSYDVGANVAIQAETGLRYGSKLRGDDADIAGLGLASINNTKGRLSVPISLKLRVGF
jgi:hypothetical protein